MGKHLVHHPAEQPDTEPNYKCCLDCTGFNLRKATRAVSQLYDDMLRQSGIRGTQFSLLVAIRMAGPVSVTQLADKAVMDRTTLTRNLDVLEKQGLIRVTAGQDRRTRLATLSDEGRAVLAKAYPLWEQAQAYIKDSLSEARLRTLMEGLANLVEVTQGR